MQLTTQRLYDVFSTKGPIQSSAQEWDLVLCFTGFPNGF
jgi:hypothetical protein